MKKIGITGGIGSGKSVISHILSNMGYPVYDSDSWAKILMNSDSHIKKSLISHFGKDCYINNVLNKTFLAQQIFNNKENLTFVNSTVHPIVKKHFLEWANNQNSKFIFIESAILFSSGINNIIDKTIFVDAPQEIRLQRAILRDNSTIDAINNRIKNQLPFETYDRSHSDFIIQNDNKSLIIPQLLSILNNID